MTPDVFRGLYCEAHGNGFPLVLISGGGVLDRRGWDQQFETFARDHRVVRYEVRGIGKSVRPSESFSHSDDLYELLAALRIERAHLVALSVGAAVAIDFCLEHPEMVGRLILAAAGTSDDAKSAENLQGLSMLAAITKNEGLERTIQMTLDSPFVLSKANTAAREAVRRIYLDNHDVFESGFPVFSLWRPTEPPAGKRLSSIQAQVLVVRGDNDSPAYSTMTTRIAADIPGAREVVIAGGTHFLNLEKAAEFDTAVLEFLKT